MFDRVYCIHLPNDERRASIETQLRKVGLVAQFVHARPPASGFSMTNMRRAPGPEFGVNLSHIKAVVHAMADGARCPLFVEDDVVIGDGLAEVLSELPDDWDVLYLGGHPREPVKQATSRLARVGRFSFAEAYAVRGTELRSLVDTWCDRIGQPHAMFDFILGEFAATRVAYAAYPPVTSQPPNISQISGKLDDKRGLVARGWAANLSIKSA